MWLDSTRLMYETFLNCRHLMPDAEPLLGVLAQVLDRVATTGELVVEVPDAWGEFAAEFAPNRDGEDPRLHPGNEGLFALVDLGTTELRRLLAAGDHEAVRELGYALHVLPALLWHPERFDLAAFSANMRIPALAPGKLRPSFRELLEFRGILAPEEAAEPDQGFRNG